MNSVLKLALSAALLAFPVSSAVHAQTATPRSNPTQPSAAQPNTARTDYSSVYLDKLAAALGLTRAQLDAKILAARTATVDQMLRDGTITQDQATRMKQDAQNPGMNFFGGRGGRGGFGGGDSGPGSRGDLRGGPGLGTPSAVLDAAAQALGLTPDALRTQLSSGQTLTAIAQQKGVSASKVSSAVIAALKTQLSSDVKAGRITQAQADQIVSAAQQDPNFGLRTGRGRGLMDRGQGGQGAQPQADPGTQG